MMPSMNSSARSPSRNPSGPAARPKSTTASVTAKAPRLAGVQVALADLLATRHWRAPHAPRTSIPLGAVAGARLSKLRGRGIDFSEVRLYQPGDDIRTIDWRVTARKNKPHTKIFREERERPTLVVIDQTQSMFFGSRVRTKSVAAAEFGAIAAWRTLAGNDRVGGLVIGNTATHSHKPLRSVRAVVRLLADLATSNQALSRTTRLESQAHFQESLLQIRRLVHTSYRVLLISDFLTAADAWRETLRALARHNQLTVIRLSDPLERELPPAERYTVTDGAARWQFHTGNTRLRRRYAERYERREAELASFCAAHMIRYLSYATDDPAAPGDWL